MLYFLYRTKCIILAPLYFHFGHHFWFIETMSFFGNLTDADIIFIISAITIFSLILDRNWVFLSSLKHLPKTEAAKIIWITFLAFVKNFFNTRVIVISLLATTFYFYLKNKFKK